MATLEAAPQINDDSLALLDRHARLGIEEAFRNACGSGLRMSLELMAGVAKDEWKVLIHVHQREEIREVVSNNRI